MGTPLSLPMKKRIPTVSATLIVILILLLVAIAARAEEPPPQGLVTVDATGAKRFLPLKSTSVRIHVTGGVAESEVVQTFTNDTNSAIEAVYLFPLPANATVTDMELKFADRVIRSVVKEKEEARTTYEKAKSEGKKAALVEQERPNMFTTSVTNFLPGETVQVSFRCIHPLEFEAGAYALNFPMTVGPRYIPGNVPAAEAERITAPILPPKVDPEHRLDLVVDIRGIPVGRIDSSTHAIQIAKVSPGISEVRLASGSTIPNCDFGLRITLAPGDAPVVTTLESENNGSHYAMVNIFPPLTSKLLEAAKPMPRDVLFLIDTSGSMSGDSIGQARAGLLKCLGMLRPEDNFAIVRFSDTFSAFAPEARPADKSTLEAARSFVGNLVADGGTEMQPALENVLSFPARDGAMRLVVFLTDGDVGNEESLLRLINTKLGSTRLFTFAIGSAPNEFLIREMAKLGRGEARTIQSHEDIDRVMQDFFRTLDTPVLTDAELVWKDARGFELGNVEYYPARLPDLFRDRPVRVFAKLPAGFRGAVTVRASGLGHRFEENVPLDAKNNANSSALEKLFGRARIDELMVQWITNTDTATRDRLRKDVIATALEHQLITQFTSRVAVEEKISRNPLDKLFSGKVPLPLPRGWDPSQFVATATSDSTKLLAALLLVVFAALCRWAPKSWR
jgi:Ca-activated chloride channel family protein